MFTGCKDPLAERPFKSRQPQHRKVVRITPFFPARDTKDRMGE
jgi:hypothetical protein